MKLRRFLLGALAAFAALAASPAAAQIAGGGPTIFSVPGGGGSAGSITATNVILTSDMSAGGHGLSDVGEIVFGGTDTNVVLHLTGGGSLRFSNDVNGAMLTFNANGGLEGLKVTSETNVAAKLTHVSSGYTSNYFGASDGAKALALLQAFSDAAALDTVEIFSGNYALSNKLDFKMGMKLKGQGETATRITFYGTNAISPENLCQFRDNCSVSGIEFTNWWGEHFFQNFCGYNYLVGYGVRYTNVTVSDCTIYSHTDLDYQYGSSVDDPARPPEASIFYDNCKLRSQWDFITTADNFDGLDWQDLMLFRFRNCTLENWGTNSTNVNYSANDGGQRLFRTTDGLIEIAGSQYRSGTHVVFENTVVIVHPNQGTTCVLFLGTPVLTNNPGFCWFGTNHTTGSTASVLAGAYGLLWTNGVQFGPVKQLR